MLPQAKYPYAICDMSLAPQTRYILVSSGRLHDFSLSFGPLEWFRKVGLFWTKKNKIERKPCMSELNGLTKLVSWFAL